MLMMHKCKKSYFHNRHSSQEIYVQMSTQLIKDS